ncbi:hypothetical protein [Baekduia sp. Peel2402]|uniref:hypothetical protein n=1 Tax=Baekduia sp. Peel2402 TaxID=3458296 RepID=UPI00403E6D70
MPATPAFGHDGEPCPACGAPLAGDQRYCLHCGARRPEARLEFLDVLDADVRARQGAAFAGPPPAGGFAPAAAPHAAAPSGVAGRLNANAGLLAVAALLVLMLLIGLLLGHWVTDRNATNNGAAAATPAPQVIKVEGTAAPAAASGDSGSGSSDSGGSGSSSSSSSKSSKSKASSSDDTAKAPKDSVAVDKLDSKKAVEDAVKKGKPISTGGDGKLPPKDDKAPAGGADFEEIG